eukprot:m.69550 g.69550  ORF g.69550 m.69550 type:complete len:68 (-) comp16028_c0_seq4:207-410(-)
MDGNSVRDIDCENPSRDVPVKEESGDCSALGVVQQLPELGKILHCHCYANRVQDVHVLCLKGTPEEE